MKKETKVKIQEHLFRTFNLPSSWHSREEEENGYYNIQISPQTELTVDFYGEENDGDGVSFYYTISPHMHRYSERIQISEIKEWRLLENRLLEVYDIFHFFFPGEFIEFQSESDQVSFEYCFDDESRVDELLWFIAGLSKFIKEL